MERVSRRQQQVIAEKRAKKKRNSIIGSVSVAGLAAAVGLSAWAINNEGHDDTSAVPAKISCEAPNAGAWGNVPTNFKASVIAKGLGVSESQVRRGWYGPATCERPVSPADISSGNPVLVNIKNIGNTCMAIGLQAEAVEASNEVLAVCAAP